MSLVQISCGHCGYTADCQGFCVEHSAKALARLAYQSGRSIAEITRYPVYRCWACRCTWKVVVNEGRGKVLVLECGDPTKRKAA